MVENINTKSRLLLSKRWLFSDGAGSTKVTKKRLYCEKIGWFNRIVLFFRRIFLLSRLRLIFYTKRFDLSYFMIDPLMLYYL